MIAKESAQSEERPKVSVCIVTYNQRDYISECLESVVTQQTDFPFEVIVGDDASTDGTADIVRDYAARHPHLIRPLLHETNLGPFENYRLVHRAARGEYVAHTDGDDAMLPDKLAKQAAFLDRNLESAAVFHKLAVIDKYGHLLGKFWPKKADAIFGTEYLLKNHPIVGHSSLMYRRGFIDEILNDDKEFIDFMIYFTLSLKGDMGFIDSCLGIYRTGVGISNINYKWINHVLQVFNTARNHKIPNEWIRAGEAHQYFQAAHNALYKKNFEVFQTFILESCERCRISKRQVIFYKLRNFPKILLLIRNIYVKMRDINRLIFRIIKKKPFYYA